MTHKSKIKVVEIIADSGLGGGPSHVLGILNNLDKDKFECFLICPAGELSVRAKEIRGVNVFNVEMRSKHDLRSFFQLRETLHKIQAKSFPFAPMIAHFHGARAGFIGRLVMPRHMINVYTEHSLNENYHLSNRFYEMVQKRLIARLNQRTDLVIAVSTAVKDYLLKKKLAPKERTIVIPNGLDLEEFSKTSAKKEKINEVNHAPIIGFIGSLNRQKGIPYLLDAMPMILKHFPLATLEIIGKGPEKNYLRAKIETLKISRHVSFLGEKDEPAKYMKEWDVFVLPSISETFGIVLLEAMQTGIPVIASNIGGIKDIVTDKKNGLLFQPKSGKEIAEAVIEIFDNPVLAAKLKRSAFERVEEFDWRKVIKKLEDVYSGLAQSKKNIAEGLKHKAKSEKLK